MLVWGELRSGTTPSSSGGLLPAGAQRVEEALVKLGEEECLPMIPGPVGVSESKLDRQIQPRHIDWTHGLDGVMRDQLFIKLSESLATNSILPLLFVYCARVASLSASIGHGER